MQEIVWGVIKIRCQTLFQKQGGALEILCQSDRIQYSKGLEHGNQDRRRVNHRADTRG